MATNVNAKTRTISVRATKQPNRNIGKNRNALEQQKQPNRNIGKNRNALALLGLGLWGEVQCGFGARLGRRFSGSRFEAAFNEDLDGCTLHACHVACP